MKQNSIRQPEILSTIYEPIALLAIYNNTTKFYYEISGINNGVPTGFKPIPEKKINDIGISMIKETTFSFKGRVPESMIYVALGFVNTMLIWRTKPCRKNLFFSRETGIKSGEYALPGLIWKLTNTAITVFAYKEYLGDDTVLYNAPFFNTSNTGSVCLGVGIKAFDNNKVDSFEKLMECAYTAFFETNFTYARSKKIIKGNLSALYKENPETFPDSVLIKTKLTLKSIFDEFEKRHTYDEETEI